MQPASPASLPSGLPRSPIAPFLLCLAWLATAAGAQVALPVADLNPLTEENFGSDPLALLSLGARAVFLARASASGAPTWWGTDGTDAGTEPLPLPLGGYQSMDAVGGRALLVITEALDSSTRLWSSDGSPAGTERLTPLEERHVFGGKAVGPDRYFFFTSEPLDAAFHEDPRERVTLWHTDGTAGGTERLRSLGTDRVEALGGDDGVFYFLVRREFEPGQPVPRPLRLWRSDGTSAGTREIRSLGRAVTWFQPVALGARLFFFTADSFSDPRHLSLWTTDGTRAGTRELRRFGVEGFGNTRMVAVRGRVYLLDPERPELWTSDGTVAGTVRLPVLPSSPSPCATVELPQELDGRAVFLVSDGDAGAGVSLFTTDGTRAGTRPLVRLAPPRPCGEGGGVGHLVPSGDRLFFLGDLAGHGTELWVSDATAAGTHEVLDICPGSCDGVSSPLFSDGEGRVLFEAYDPEHGVELWRSDGTAAGTEPVSDFALSAPFFNTYPPVRGRVGESLLFAADDGQHGVEPWIVPIASGEARLLLDVGAPGAAGSTPLASIELDGALLFVACDGEAIRLFRTEGSAATTRALAEISSGCGEFMREFELQQRNAPPLLSKAHDLVYVNVGSLWRSDGTAAGTFTLFEEPLFRYLPFFVSNPVELGERTVFWRFEGTNENSQSLFALWSTDGTRAGTARWQALPVPLYPSQLTAIGDLLYFLADDGTSGNVSAHKFEAWRSDGTEAGTFKLTQHDAPYDPYPAHPRFVEAAGRVFFRLENPSEPEILWSTDGTREGTRRLSAENGFPPEIGSHPVLLGELGGELLSLSRLERGTLWATDGTPAGTRRVKDLGRTQDLAAGRISGGRAHFLTGSTYAPPDSLWVSDGTADGTLRVASVAATPLGPALAEAGSRVYFSGFDEQHGAELWSLAAGSTTAERVQDLFPGVNGSYVDVLIVAGDRLYVSADDGVLGRELWSLPLDETAAGCVPSASALCLAERFRVEVSWRDPSGERHLALPHSAGARAAFFTFGNENSPELAVKVLDGTTITGAHWLFGGGLTNLPHEITVLDTATRATRRYLNRTGQLRSFADLDAFRPGNVPRDRAVAISLGETPGFDAPPVSPRRSGVERGDAAPCTPSPTRLCLLDGRFAVEAVRSDSAPARASSFSDGAGWFWLAREDNPELVVKLVDARTIGSGAWLFASSLGTRGLRLTVHDLEAGTSHPYLFGAVSSVLDATTFLSRGSDP